MTTTHCARFPNLFSSPDDASGIITKRSLLALDASEETLYRAWAKILKAYSGEDGGVSFRCKHGMVTVGSPKNDLQYHTFENSQDVLFGGQTGVFVDSGAETQEQLALQLNYRTHDQKGEIISCGHVPDTHLIQLESELRMALLADVGSSSKLSHVPDQTGGPMISLSILNDHPLKLPGPDRLHDLISRLDPSTRIAVEYEESEEVIETISYSQLDHQAAALAARICSALGSSNHATQPIIPILLPQSPQLYVAMIAILRMGAAFCPLPLDAPPDRLRFILQDLSASVAVTSSVYGDKFRTCTNVSSVMVAHHSEDSQDPTEMRPSIAFHAKSNDIAYIMYTSGSTGQPKGVPVSHLAATQSLMAHDRLIPAYDRFLQFASPTFDVSMFEIFFTLFRGSTLVCCERSRLLSDLPSAMRRLKVDACELTPTVAAGLLQRRANVPSLKLLLTIGEMLTPAVVQEFGGDKTKASILWGMYGPTEAAIHCTIQPAFPSKLTVGNIGFPLDTVSAYIIAPSEAGEAIDYVNVLPTGHVGELAVGGFQLASGYLNRPKQTSEAFIDSKKHGRLYRTGDRARVLPDGSIECLGRISSGQVKLRGQRIELGEIQHAAARTEGCLDAVASVVRGSLVVFCLGVDDLTAEAVLTTCRQWLPAFMVPKDAIALTDYPRLPSGKVDRKQLERDYDFQKSAWDDDVGNALSTELIQIKTILEEVLGQTVNANISPVQMGLDSLSAIKAASALRRKGLAVTPLQLLEAKSLTHLASRRAQPDATQSTQRIGVEVDQAAYDTEILHPWRSEIENIITCTPLQTSMLVETMKEAKAYCNWVELQLGPEWSVLEISQWLETLAANNAILRSGFCQVDSVNHPFGLVRWKHLLKDQIREVTRLTRLFSLHTDADFLRPVHFQICKESNHTTLLMQIHHSLYDGWSLDLLLKDLADLIVRKPVTQRPQFDLVAGYYRELKTPSSIQYWQDHLHDYRPTPMPNYNGYHVARSSTERFQFPFSASLSKIRAWAIDLGVGAQTVFQATLACLLSKYLGTPDIVIGTVTSGRTIPVDDIEDIVGPCVLTLPLRVNVSHSKRVKDLARDISICNRRMLEHGAESLHSIKNGCGLKTSENLWDFLFVWQETLESRTAKSQSVKIVDSFDRLECPVTLEVEPRGNGIMGNATYNPSVFPKEQVILLFEQMDALVDHFISSSDLLLDNIGICFPTAVRSVANPCPQVPKFDRGLAAMVEKYARSRPDDPALVFATAIEGMSDAFDTLTYQQLNKRANRVARLLIQKVGVDSELVCVCMEKSLDLYVSILAVLKTGRGYLPITPSTPRERIHTIVNEASVGVCLSRSSTSTSLGLGDFCSVLDLDIADTSKISDHDLNIAYEGSNTAYAVFTSGSTGTPKGVQVTQQNLLSNLETLSRIYPIFAEGRLLQACSQAFDVSVFEIFFAWYTGMCLCSASNDVLFSDIERCIRRLGITHLSLTPTVAALISPENVPKVKFLVTAGEAVTEKVMGTWADKGLYQGYGPSETTNICTLKSKVTSSDLINNIGRPLPNTSAFVMNLCSEEILPSGAVGELCFGGDQIFRGYLNQPKLNSEKIVEHPQYGRLYRSGDTGRLLPNGEILFSGRTDDQVKIRGQRVELGEINRRIVGRPGIFDCATLVLNHQRSPSMGLVAFWVPESSQTSGFDVLDVSATSSICTVIRSTFRDLASVLPHYMIPTALIPITSIPMTLQGKIDKRKLISCYQILSDDMLDACGSAIENGEDRKWSEIERTIAHALSRVLNCHVRVVEKHSSFFRLGLDSISAIRFGAHLRHAMKRPVPVSIILQNPSTARLAVELQKTSSPVLPEMENSENVFKSRLRSSIQENAQKAGLTISNIRPCTPLQEAMLSMGVSANKPSSYCNTMLVRTKIEVERLKGCWAAMASRHEILRTYFVSTDDPAYPFAQVVLSHYIPKWISRQEFDLTNLVECASQIALSELPPPVDSLRPPYFLNVIGRTNDCYLQFSCHHALHDGTAIQLLFDDMERLVRGDALPKPVPFEPFLREMVRHRSSKAMSFWQEQLKGFRPSLLKSNGHMHAVQTYDLDIKLSALERSCQELAISVLSASQSAWAKTVQSLLGCTDICFGNVVSGRTLSIDGLDKLVGPTFNTVPIRVKMMDLKTNMELLRALQHNNADLLPHQLTPLRSIQSELGFGGSGIFSTMLLYQQAKLELDPSIWTLTEEFGEMNFPVILELIPHTSTDTLALHFHYEESILSGDHACETIQVFVRALKSCLQHPASGSADFEGYSSHTTDSIQPSLTYPQSANLNTPSAKNTGFTPSERAVVEAVSAIIPLGSFHVHSDTTIHQLGVDSIGAIQLASNLRSTIGLEITAADILEKPKISDIAELIEEKGNLPENSVSFDFQGFENQYKPSICHELALSLDDVESVLPCTPLQMGLLSQFIRSESMYVNCVTYEMDSTWTAENLEAAWKAVRNSHVMLRTGFVSLQDPHMSFAMVSYSAENCDIPVQVLRKEDLSESDIGQWRQVTATHFHEKLSQPPWTVLIVDNGSRLYMHIAILHSLYDAHSLNIILDDLVAARTPSQQSMPAAIHPVLSSIINSSNPTPSEEGIDKRIRYWKDAFSNASINKFPNLQPLHFTTGLTEVQSMIGSRPMKELESLCRKAGVSLQAAGQAAWAQLLSALVGEKNVTFGVVLSGRDAVTGSEKVVFPCLTTVPVPVEVSKSNRGLLEAMMKFNASIRRHQFTPLKDIQRWIQRPNEALFDTIFAFQKLSAPSQVKPWTVVDEVSTSEYAISLEIEPEGEKLIMRATFMSDMLPKEQAQTLLAQFDALLVNLITFPDDNGYDRLTENVELFSITPAKQSTLPSPVQYLHHFVESQAQDSPERIALEFAHQIVQNEAQIQTWTYAKLNEEGNRVCSLLLDRGAVPGDRVAICFEKCPEASFAILGILKAGCAYVALDPGAPAARKDFIVKDSKARLLLTLDRNANRFADSTIKIPIVYVEEGNNHEIPGSPPTIPSRISPQSVCYCLYTSGTTGTPKGCEITHENAVQAMRAFSKLFSGRWDEHSKWLQFASFHFDVSVLEQYWTWSEGLCVVSAPRDLIFEDLARTIRVLGITHIDLTPSLASLLHPDDVPSLCQGVFITGGEQLKQEILDVWGSLECIHNGYGPTEATIGVTMYTRVPKNGKPANIGPQFDNVGSYVLLPGTETPVLRGGIGELCVSGKLVGKGYLNQLDLTKEKFPILTKFKERIYRTGDLVRILHDGSFIFLGRADDQVKLRGQRLELSEINTTIKRGVTNIKDVATFVLKHPKQQREQLVTFFVVTDPSQQDNQPFILQTSSNARVIQRAREVCLAHLPGYMIPTHFIPMNRMPLSTNNKTEAKVLKSLYEGTSAETLQSLSTGCEPSRELSETEARVAGVLRKFVQVNQADLSPSSSIFELGLDSISVIGFTRALKNAGFRNAQASKVMRLATIKALASSLSLDANNPRDEEGVLASQQLMAACSHRHRSEAARILKVAPGDIEAIAPCTPLQQGMMSRTLESENLVYFASFRYRLAASIRLNQLKVAWVKALENLQILRTRFIQTDDGHIQVVLRAAELPWADRSVTQEQDVGALLDQNLKMLRKRNTFDILHPFEITVIQTPSHSVLALSIFHGLYDGNSLPLLLSVVQKQYMGDKDINYGPPFHAVLLHGPLHNARGAKSFWTQRIVGQSERINHNPRNGDATNNSPMKCSMVLRDLPTLDKRCRELNITHQAVVQACWASVLRKHHHHAVPLGVVTSGRSIDFEDAEKVIGPMFNTIPFHVEFSGDETWQSIATKCHEFNVSALPYQHTPLRDIRKWCQIGANRHLFDNLFVFQKETPEMIFASRNEIWTPLEDESFSDFPLAFEAELRIDKTMQITLVSQSHVVDERTLQRLGTLFQHAMTTLLEHPQAPVEAWIGHINGKPTASSSGEARGLHAEFSEEAATFQWTKEALLLRQEIAKLASVDELAVAPDLSIFELGLDSIDAIKLSSRLIKRNIRISVSSIMRRPTVIMMVEAVSATQEATDGQHPSLLDGYESKLMSYFHQDDVLTQEVETVLPATPLQEAMVAEMFSSHFSRYYNHDVLKLSSETNSERLKSAWQLVYNASPILRTSFKPISDVALECSFAQVILRSTEVDWIEAHHHNEAEVLASLEKISSLIRSSSPTHTYFRLTFATTPLDRFLIISTPHALYDGYSINLLHSDVFNAYDSNSVDLRPSIRPVLEDIMQASTSEAKEFWSDYLGEVKSCLVEESSLCHKGHDSLHRKEQISKVPVEILHRFCRSQGITLQALGQACWSLVLASYVHKLDVVYGVVLSGRDTEQSQKVMFPTMNTVAFHAYLHGTGSEMLRYTHENMSNIREFQHFPLRKAQTFARTGGGMLFNTLFIYQIRPGIDGEAKTPLYQSVGGASEVEFPVCVEMELFEQNLVWRVACTSDTFDSDGTQELINRMESMIDSLVNEPDSEVVSFKGEQVSIRKLPAFTIAPQNLNNGTSYKIAHDTKDELLWSDTEKKLRNILSTLSNVPEHDVHQQSTLFHLGLDSITAIKISALLRKQGINISVSNMLRASTLEGIARFVDRNQANEPQTAVEKAVPKDSVVQYDTTRLLHESGLEGYGIHEADVDFIVPASAGQVFMLNHWHNSGGDLFFPEFPVLRSRDMKTVDIFSAWACFLRRHPSLRSVFVAIGQKNNPYAQVFLKPDEAKSRKLPEEDPNGDGVSISALDFVRTSEANMGLTQRFASLSIRRLTDGEWRLGLKIHHALYDGVSIASLISELRSTMIQNRSQSDTPTSNVSWRAFTSIAYESRQSDPAKEFWTSYLEGAKKPEQMRTVISENQHQRFARYRPNLINDATPLLRFARKEGISLPAIFLSIYARLYHSLQEAGADPTHVIIGIYIANRSSSIGGLETLPTVNILPLRIDTTLSVLDSAKMAQVDLAKISDAQNVNTGLWQIYEWTGVKMGTFVNWLRLPEASTEGETLGKEGAGPQVEEEKDEIEDGGSGDFVIPGELQGSDGVREAYIPNIDVEVALRDGSLDVGVFGPTSLMSKEKVEALLHNLKEVLMMQISGA